MRGQKHARQDFDESVIGWISYTDSWMLGLTVACAVALFVNANWQQARASAARLEEEIEPYRQSIRLSPSEHERLISEEQQAAVLREALDQSTRQLSNAQQDALAKADIISALEEAVKAQRAELAALQGKLDTALLTIVSLESIQDRLMTEQARLRNELAVLEALAKQLHDKTNAADKRFAELPVVHKQLLGLQGTLGHVAILFDTSGSMGEKKYSEVSPWERAHAIVRTWLQHLDVERCMLILFSTEARVAFPESREKWRLIETDADRTELVSRLDRLVPQGGTNTYAALKLAFSYQELETIVLFTDGAPNNGYSQEFDPQEAKRIYALCTEMNKERVAQGRERVRINTVGLGNYFLDKDKFVFLKTVAELTGGEYLGR